MNVRRWLGGSVVLAAALAATVAGCGRRVVLAPERIPARNDRAWVIQKAPGAPRKEPSPPTTPETPPTSATPAPKSPTP